MTTSPAPTDLTATTELPDHLGAQVSLADLTAGALLRTAAVGDLDAWHSALLLGLEQCGTSVVYDALFERLQILDNIIATSLNGGVDPYDETTGLLDENAIVLSPDSLRDAVGSLDGAPMYSPSVDRLITVLLAGENATVLYADEMLLSEHTLVMDAYAMCLVALAQLDLLIAVPYQQLAGVRCSALTYLNNPDASTDLDQDTRGLLAAVDELVLSLMSALFDTDADVPDDNPIGAAHGEPGR